MYTGVREKERGKKGERERKRETQPDMEMMHVANRYLQI